MWSRWSGVRAPSATPRLHGPVAQWIERQPSKLRAEVRLLPGPLGPQRRMVDEGARSEVFGNFGFGERGRERRGGAHQPPSPGKRRCLISGGIIRRRSSAPPLLSSPAKDSAQSGPSSRGRLARLRLSGRGRRVGRGGLSCDSRGRGEIGNRAGFRSRWGASPLGVQVPPPALTSWDRLQPVPTPADAPFATAWRLTTSKR